MQLDNSSIKLRSGNRNLKSVSMEKCQLCGSTEDVSTLDEEFVSIVDKVCEIIINDIVTSCIECKIFLYQIQVFVDRVQQFNNNQLLMDKQKSNPFSSELEIEYESNIQHDLNTMKEGNEENETIIEESLDETFDDGTIESDNDSLAQPTIKLGCDELYTNAEIDENEIEKLYIFKCHICEVPDFENMSQLSVHTRTEHNCIPAVKCSCDKLLSTMRSLERHRAKHFPQPSDFRCTNCPKTFRTQRGLNNHFDKMHGQYKQSFICAQCGRSFSERKTLLTHEITHALPPEQRRNFQCSECLKYFISADAMRSHYAHHHEQILSFFCDVCSKGFYTRKSLKSHVEVHRENEAAICDLCNGTYKSFKLMQKHRRSHFLSQNDCLVCDICNKQFRKKSQMNFHMLIHNDTAEYSCNICTKTFKKKCYLKTHLVSHTGEKNFRCSFCERSFANPGNCRKHKLKDHPEELAAHEAKHGKKGVSNTLFV